MNDIFARSPLVLAGPFGSGKSELAIALALQARARRDDKVILVDMDLVTPFFRSREAADALADVGVRVVYPSHVPVGVDLPVLPPAVVEAIELAPVTIVDVGGGTMGSRVMGGLSTPIASRGGMLLAVINPYRPMSGTPRAIAGTIADLSRDLRLPVDGVLANPNLGASTKPEHVMEGMEIVREGAQLADVPIVAMGIGEHLMEGGEFPRWSDVLAGTAHRVCVERTLWPEWERPGNGDSREVYRGF